MNVQIEVPIRVFFRGIAVGNFYVDLLVNDRVLVEIKSTKFILPEHESQLLNYLKATGFKVGIIVNFGRSKLEWKRMVKSVSSELIHG